MILDDYASEQFSAFKLEVAKYQEIEAKAEIFILILTTAGKHWFVAEVYSRLCEIKALDDQLLTTKLLTIPCCPKARALANIRTRIFKARRWHGQDG